MEQYMVLISYILHLFSYIIYNNVTEKMGSKELGS